MPRAGAQLASLNLANEALDPEDSRTSRSARSGTCGRDSRCGACVQLDRKNVVVPDRTTSQSILVDGQRTEGVEFGVSGQLTDHWSVQGGYAWQDGELTAALGGATLAQLPEHVASLWNKYELTQAWSVGLGVIHQTEMFAAADNAVTLPDFTRVDAGVFFEPNERLRLQLNVENLLDETYYPNAHNNNITPGSPLAIRAG